MFDDDVLDAPAAKRLQEPRRNRNITEAASPEKTLQWRALSPTDMWPRQKVLLGAGSAQETQVLTQDQVGITTFTWKNL